MNINNIVFNEKVAELANALKEAISEARKAKCFREEIEHLEETLDFLLEGAEEVSACTFCGKYEVLKTCEIRDCKLCNECFDEPIEGVEGDISQIYDHEIGGWRDL